jgi:hypothetical protein
MPNFSRFIAIIRVDLLQWIRSDFFWVVFVLIALATWLSFPAGSLNYLSLTAMGALTAGSNGSPLPHLYRGMYTSAWIGLSIAYLMTLFSTTIGFFVVRGSISRDIETGVWQLLSTSPMPKLAYLVARWCSYITVFTLFYVCSCLVGVFAQYIRAESLYFRIADYALPYLFFVLPALALTAMVAILFEIQVNLRHTFGNILYGFIWLMVVIFFPKWFAFKEMAPYLAWVVDLVGYNAMQEFILRELSNTASAGVVFNRVNILLGGFVEVQPQLLSFKNQIFSLNDSLGRGAWVLLSLLGIYLASLFLAQAATKNKQVSLAFDKERGATLAWMTKLLSPLQNSQWGILLSSELMTILRTRNLFWWLAIFIVWFIQIFGDLSANPMRLFTLVMGVAGAWLLLLDIFSRTVLRDIETNTHGFIFTSISASYKILQVRLSAVLLLTWVCTLPAILRTLIIEPLVAFNIVILGATMVVLAMSLGALSRNPRLFELLACVCIYMTYEGLPFINVVDLSDTIRWWHISILILSSLILKRAWDRLRAI